MNSLTRRRIALVVLWLTGSAVAVAVAIAAIGLAGARVTSQTTMLQARDTADRGAAAGAPADPGSADSTSVLPSVDGPAAGSGETSSSSESGSPVSGATDSQSGSSPTTTSPLSGTSSKSSPGGSPTTNAVSPSAPTIVSSSQASKDSKYVAGGTVTVQCIGSAVRIVSAAPSAGFGKEVGNAGPEEVEVQFTNATTNHESHVTATCSGGVITFTTQESAGGA